MLTHALPLATLAGLAAAFYPGHALYPGSPVRALAPRQTSLDDLGDLGNLGECATALIGLVADVPLPDAEIQSWILSYAMTATTDLAAAAPTDFCPPYLTELPQSLSDNWASYSSEVLSWYSDKGDDLTSALSKCPADAARSVVAVMA
jgi:hypothetical protein